MDWLSETTHIHFLQIPNYLSSAIELNKSQVTIRSQRIGTYTVYLCVAFPSPLGLHVPHTRKGPQLS